MQDTKVFFVSFTSSHSPSDSNRSGDVLVSASLPSMGRSSPYIIIHFIKVCSSSKDGLCKIWNFLSFLVVAELSPPSVPTQSWECRGCWYSNLSCITLFSFNLFKHPLKFFSRRQLSVHDLQRQERLHHSHQVRNLPTSIYLSIIYLTIYVCIYPSIDISSSLCIYLSNYLFIYVSNYLSIYLSTYLSI